MEQTKTVKKNDLHSLKSSVAAIMGYIQLAQQKVAKTDNAENEKANEMLTKALQAADSLDEQIRKIEGIDEPLMDL